jgi:hypothetical protein
MPKTAVFAITNSFWTVDQLCNEKNASERGLFLMNLLALALFWAMASFPGSLPD